MKRLLCGMLLLALGATAVSSQSAAPAEDLPTYAESVGTEYVLLPALVFDRKGGFADLLEEKDFRVWVEGKAVDIDTFDRDDHAPVSFAFLVDTSGSMEIADKLEMARAAIRQIVARRKPGDDFALFAFADEEVLSVAPFSSDPAPLLKRLAGLEPSGKTALFDAVAATPSRLVEGKNAKRAILLFTDGVDNASRLSSLEMAEILQQVSTPVYAIGIKNASLDRLTEKEKEELALDNLRILALSSGGRMFLAGGDEDLRPLASRIEAEVRKQYLLGFTPSGQGEVKYRVVVVSVTKPGSWDVRTRRGYRGTAP
ncbi:MAG: VWA domain-containing protein [Thermoanaerobaculia bacterium]